MSNYDDLQRELSFELHLLNQMIAQQSSERNKLENEIHCAKAKLQALDEKLKASRDKIAKLSNEITLMDVKELMKKEKVESPVKCVYCINLGRCCAVCR